MNSFKHVTAMLWVQMTHIHILRLQKTKVRPAAGRRHFLTLTLTSLVIHCPNILSIVSHLRCHSIPCTFFVPFSRESHLIALSLSFRYCRVRFHLNSSGNRIRQSSAPLQSNYFLSLLRLLSSYSFNSIRVRLVKVKISFIQIKTKEPKN
jgi:hypothetical protein